MATFVLIACHPSPRDLTLVSGKTVYGDLALEDVYIEVYRLEQSRWRYFSDTRSGYHGSFRIHIPPGTYSLKASKTIRIGEDKVSVTGILDKLEVKGSSRRIDQIVVIMVPVSGS